MALAVALAVPLAHTLKADSLVNLTAAAGGATFNIQAEDGSNLDAEDGSNIITEAGP